jgi:hypothetical protein
MKRPSDLDFDELFGEGLESLQQDGLLGGTVDVDHLFLFDEFVPEVNPLNDEWGWREKSDERASAPVHVPLNDEWGWRDKSGDSASAPVHVNWKINEEAVPKVLKVNPSSPGLSEFLPGVTFHSLVDAKHDVYYFFTTGKERARSTPRAKPLPGFFLSGAGERFDDELCPMSVARMNGRPFVRLEKLREDNGWFVYTPSVGRMGEVRGSREENSDEQLEREVRMMPAKKRALLRRILDDLEKQNGDLAYMFKKADAREMFRPGQILALVQRGSNVLATSLPSVDDHVCFWSVCANDKQNEETHVKSWPWPKVNDVLGKRNSPKWVCVVVLGVAAVQADCVELKDGVWCAKEFEECRFGMYKNRQEVIDGGLLVFIQGCLKDLPKLSLGEVKHLIKERVSKEAVIVPAIGKRKCRFVDRWFEMEESTEGEENEDGKEEGEEEKVEIFSIQDLIEFVRHEKCVVLSAAAGFGKSTTCREIVRIANEPQDCDWIFLPVIRLARVGDCPFDPVLLLHQCAGFERGVAEQIWHTIKDDRRVVWSFDGFEEVQGQVIADRIRNVEWVHHMLVTTRPLAFEIIPGALCLSICHFDSDDIVRIAGDFGCSDSVLNSIRENDALLNLMRTPLICEIICYMQQSTLLQLASLSSVGEVLYQVTRFVGQRGMTRLPIDPGKRLPIEQGVLDDFSRLTLARFHQEETRFEPFEVFDAQLQESGWLASVDGSLGKFEFVHGYFLEFFAARGAVLGLDEISLSQFVEDHISNGSLLSLVRFLLEKEGRVRAETEKLVRFVTGICMERSKLIETTVLEDLKKTEAPFFCRQLCAVLQTKNDQLMAATCLMEKLHAVNDASLRLMAEVAIEFELYHLFEALSMRIVPTEREIFSLLEHAVKKEKWEMVRVLRPMLIQSGFKRFFHIQPGDRLGNWLDKKCELRQELVGILDPELFGFWPKVGRELIAKGDFIKLEKILNRGEKLYISHSLGSMLSSGDALGIELAYRFGSQKELAEAILRDSVVDAVDTFVERYGREELASIVSKFPSFPGNKAVKSWKMLLKLDSMNVRVCSSNVDATLLERAFSLKCVVLDKRSFHWNADQVPRNVFFENLNRDELIDVLPRISDPLKGLALALGVLSADERVNPKLIRDAITNNNAWLIGFLQLLRIQPSIPDDELSALCLTHGFRCWVDSRADVMREDVLSHIFQSCKANFATALSLLKFLNLAGHSHRVLIVPYLAFASDRETDPDGRCSLLTDLEMNDYLLFLTWWRDSFPNEDMFGGEMLSHATKLCWIVPVARLKDVLKRDSDWLIVLRSILWRMCGNIMGGPDPTPSNADANALVDACIAHLSGKPVLEEGVVKQLLADAMHAWNSSVSSWLGSRQFLVSASSISKLADWFVCEDDLRLKRMLVLLVGSSSPDLVQSLFDIEDSFVHSATDADWENAMAERWPGFEILKVLTRHCFFPALKFIVSTCFADHVRWFVQSFPGWIGHCIYFAHWEHVEMLLAIGGKAQDRLLFPESVDGSTMIDVGTDLPWTKEVPQLDLFLKKRRRDLAENFSVQANALTNEIRAVLKKHDVLYY